MDLQQFISEFVLLKEKLYRYSLKMLGNTADAEDNVQEVLLRLWTMRQELGKYHNPAAFAMQITKNQCIDRLRLRKNTVDLSDTTVQQSQPSVHQQLELSQAVGLVERIITTLPQLQQLIITLRDIEGYEIDEIAAITGSNASAVRMNLSRARTQVKDNFFKLSGQAVGQQQSSYFEIEL